MNLIGVIAHAPLLSQPPLAVAVDVVVFLATIVVAAAIVMDFMSYGRQRRAVKADARSLVETGSMTAFFLVYYLVIRFRLLEVRIPGGTRLAMIAVGMVLIITGVTMNVLGRFMLGANWANQIRIYEGHTLNTTGPYAVVRHPLYASLIAIFVGGSLVYSNALSLLLTLGVFVPMMVVRAKKEEALLLKAFAGRYVEYQARTGMLCPRLRRRRWGT
jgi:protein-S-isoprenylcysteine O-methyltransferase Ste14